MLLYPEVQRKAQVELDNIVGPERLPDLSDYQRCDYLKALVLETLRWMPVLPSGVPHMLITNDHYKGYRLPKGTVVIPVSISHTLSE